MKKLLLLLVLLISMSSYSQNNSQSKLTGVVTYFFNKYQGNKPDISSKVYIIPIKYINSDSIHSLYNYSHTESYIYMYNSYKAMGYKAKQSGDNIIPIDIQNEYNRISNFDSIDKKAMSIFYSIKYNDSTITKTVDANGNYSADLNYGEYFVIIKSVGRNKATLSECTGNIRFTKITIRKNQDSDFSYNFPIH